MSFFRGTRGVAELAEHPGQLAVSSRKVGFEANRRPKRGRRLRQFSLLFENGAQGVMGLRIARLRLDCLMELFGRLFKFTPLPEEDSKRVVRIGEVRLQRDCILQFDDGLVELVLEFVSEAEIVM